MNDECCHMCPWECVLQAEKDTEQDLSKWAPDD